MYYVDHGKAGPVLPRHFTGTNMATCPKDVTRAPGPGLAVMLKRWSGNVWLGWAFLLLCLTLVSTVLAFVTGFVHDPDDNAASFYRDKIPERQWVMGLSMFVPATSAAAAGASIFARPRTLARIAAGSIVLLLAIAAVWFCWAMGIDDLEKFNKFANRFA